ncbi:MAG: YraN family protein [Actinomycetota bacterium]|nr:YraN family protein [Actinomycetota bacterium]
MRAKDAIGRYGEDVAVRHLHDAGLQVLDRNWRCPRGELDIVAMDGSTLVFCEVKTRSGVEFGTPAEAVGPAKARRIRGLACEWLLANRPPYAELRFDVLSVLRQRRGAATVEHLRAAF